MKSPPPATSVQRISERDSRISARAASKIICPRMKHEITKKRDADKAKRDKAKHDKKMQTLVNSLHTEEKQTVNGNIASILKFGFKSRIAMFYIDSATRSKTFQISLNEACEVWKKQKDIIYKIHTKTQQFNGNLCEKNTYFAVNVIFYLLYKRLMWTVEESDDLDTRKVHCPYMGGAKNFIISLAMTNICNCLGYTQYVLAAAEECDYELISCCSTDSHINIVISSEEGDNVLNIANCASSNHNLFAPSTFDFCLGRTTFQTSKIYAIIDAGFENNFFIQVKSLLSELEFRDKFVPYNIFYWAQVETFESILCNQDDMWQCSIWNTIVMIINMSGVRKKWSQTKYTHDILVLCSLWNISLEVLISLKNELKITQSLPDTPMIPQVLRQMELISKAINYFPTPSQVSQMIRSAYFAA